MHCGEREVLQKLSLLDTVELTLELLEEIKKSVDIKFTLVKIPSALFKKRTDFYFR